MTDNLREALDRRLSVYKETLDSTPARRAIFNRYPIQDRIPHVPLADVLPTPVTRLETGSGNLWVKRDDLSSTLYGGNKVRKLEFVLAAARERNCTQVVVGATGSHQVLATAIYTRLLGIRCMAVLFPQPSAPEEELVSAVLDALEVPVHRAPSANRSPLTTAGVLLSRRHGVDRKCLVYPGGSSPAGVLGYVNCGLEIAGAVEAGECPEPDAVYTAFGTGGTAVGLAIGLVIGGLKSRVHAVRVAEPIVSNRTHLRTLEWRTRRLLRGLDIRYPDAFSRIRLVADYLGDGYGHPLPQAGFATDLAVRADLPIDQTYTAKALAAAIDHQRRNRSESVMFLDTLSAVDPVWV